MEGIDEGNEGRDKVGKGESWNNNQIQESIVVRVRSLVVLVRY